MYSIKRYTYNKAKKLGVTVKPSTNKTKKIDVFTRTRSDVRKKIASIGANGMNDYPTYIQKRGLAYANTRRKLYRQRHEKDRHVRGSAGYYADKLLW